MSAAGLVARGVEYLEAARDNLAASRWNVAYEEARTACELFAKAILRARTGTHPRDHNVAPSLFQASLVPEGIEPRELSRFLGDHVRGTYGFHEPLTEEELEAAFAMADIMRAHAEAAP